jgi:hypothetical protein
VIEDLNVSSCVRLSGLSVVGNLEVGRRVKNILRRSRERIEK